jgi:hypothetical protein
MKMLGARLKNVRTRRVRGSIPSLFQHFALFRESTAVQMQSVLPKPNSHLVAGTIAQERNFVHGTVKFQSYSVSAMWQPELSKCKKVK